MNMVFQIISPTPNYPDGTSAALLAGLDWDSSVGKAIIKKFKDGLKKSLFDIQGGVCCFCRRALYDDYANHLEHFLEKKIYPEFTFEIRNLALSCGTCNSNKEKNFKRFNKTYKKIYSISLGAGARHVPALHGQLPPGSGFPVTPSSFRWVSPHFHQYSQHIILKRGWVFTGLTPQGRRTISGCELNDVAVLEERALQTRLGRRGGRLSLLVGAAAELSTHRAADVYKAVAKVLIRRREAATT